jgi:apolipoprotein N-acyltransferase
MLRSGLQWLRSAAGWRADLAAGVLGALSAAALPPVHAIPMLLLAVPGLLLLIGAAPRARVAFRRGFWFGFGHHLFGLYWITEAILVEAAHFWWLVPFAVPGLAAVLAIFIAIPCAMAWRAPAGLSRVLVFAGAWTLFDMARQFVATGFPWNSWGSVWELPGRAGDVMIQPAAWVGVHGLTLATILLAALPVLGRRGWMAGAAALAIWIAAGSARLAGPQPRNTGQSAVLVQGNVAEGQRWDPQLMRDIFRHYLQLTHDGVDRLHGQPGVVIWPETASTYLMGRDAGARAALMDATQGLPALVGSLRFNAADAPLNSLFAVIGPGPPAAVYDKWHLVPFGEYIPHWLPFPVKFGLPVSFVPGTGPETLHVPGLPPVGALICYEAIFPGEIVDEADRPAWLVNITNDAWFGNSTGPRQHLAAVRMRAVEEGLPIMRAANTGISAAFDARGHQLARLGMDRSGVVVVPLTGELPPTLFSRLGLAGTAVLAFVIFLMGLGTALRFRNSADSRTNV